MIRLSVFLKRKPGMSVEEFRRYWHGPHPAFTTKIPGLLRYVQSPAHPSEYEGKTPLFDGIADHWLENEETLNAGLQSPEAQAAIQDLENFTDTAANVFFLCTEKEVFKK